MKAPNQLVQIVAQPYQLTVDELLMIILRLPFRGTARFLFQKQGPPEMSCPQA
jgi:hypothetical protein